MWRIALLVTSFNQEVETLIAMGEAVFLWGGGRRGQDSPVEEIQGGARVYLGTEGCRASF